MKMVWRRREAQISRAQGLYADPVRGRRKTSFDQPLVGLDTHIDDITGVIDYEELSDMVPIGHSFSGMAITGAADQRRSAIKHIVFFDAPIPARWTHARYSCQNAGATDPKKAAKREAALENGYKMVFWNSYPIQMLASDDYPEAQAKLRRLITPHPFKNWTDELILENGGWEGLPRTYFRPSAQELAPSSPKMWAPAEEPGWNLIELPVGRMGMMAHPRILAAAFAKLS